MFINQWVINRFFWFLAVKAAMWVKEYLSDSSFNQLDIETDNSKKLHTYEWKLKPELLKNLYIKLVTKGFINKKINSLDDFIAIFNEKPIDEIKPIIWQSTTVGQPLFFIHKLQNHSLKPIGQEKPFPIKRFRECFHDINEEPFKDNLLKTPKQRIETLSKNVQKEISETLNF
ncbi:MAG: hypothetical protein U5L09_09855 [Bacteroidales bacterium]|nr:hypothetical protein [Bacteroidales bacterium]